MVNRIESAIQKAVINYVHTEYPKVLITTTANERSYKETAQIGSIGIPDLILFALDGSVLFLELKKRTGKLSPSQKDWFAANNNLPHTKEVAYGFAQAREIINNWVTLLQCA